MADERKIHRHIGSSSQVSNRQEVARRIGVGNDAVIAPVAIDHLRKDRVRAKIVDKYNSIGRNMSPLGFAMTGEVVYREGLATMEFRGGSITLANEGAEPMVWTQKQVHVYLQALKCFGDQESEPGEDEAFVIVTVFPKENIAKARTFSFGPWNMSPGRKSSDAPREIMMDVEPQTLVIHTLVMEQDSGDQEKVRAAVEKQMQKIVATAINAVVGDSSGAEIPTVDRIKDLFPGVGGLVAGAIEGIFGLGDDLIGVDTIEIPYQALEGLRKDGDHDKNARHYDGITFTHETSLITDGDASYKAYYDVFMNVQT